jgi:aminoglycoside phosphotransferase (APT) family kinase protein
MRRIPTDHANWRTALFAGEITTAVGDVIGEGLARLHSLPVTDAWIADPGGSVRDELRVRPFYEETARHLPRLRDQFGGVIARMQSPDGRRFVHGDASPKNVLIGIDGSIHLVDWEVFHLGDAAFDVGMFGAHLLCKSVADPTRRREFADLMEHLWLSYATNGGAAEQDAVVAHAGGIALARIYGRSPADYLNDDARADIQRIASALLEAPNEVDQLVSAIRRGAVA